jgi:hypothetical protein
MDSQSPVKSSAGLAKENVGEQTKFALSVQTLFK